MNPQDSSVLEPSSSIAKDAGRLSARVEVPANRKSAEGISALEASELSYRRLFEAARDGILILDAETGRVTDVNPFLVELLGFSREEMIGQTVGELSPFRDLAWNQEMLEQLQREGYVRYEDLPLETRGGHRVEVEFVSNVYLAGDQKVIQCNIRDITERKRAETLRAEMAAIVNFSEDAIVGKTMGGTITSWNSGAEKIFGYTAAEAVGRPIQFLNVPGEPDEEAAILVRMARGETIKHFETVRAHKSGRRVDLSATISPLKDRFGAVVGVSTIARDISERRRTSEALRQKEAQLNAVKDQMAQIVHGMNEACFALDANWRFTFVNDRTATLLHCRREEMLGQSIFGVLPKLLGAPTEGYFRRTMVERLPMAFEAFSPQAERWLDIRLFPSGTGLAAFLLDVQDRKVAEAQMQTTTLHLQLMLQNMLNAFIVWESVFDADGRYVSFRFGYCNDAYERIAGVNGKEVFGRDVFEVWPTTEQSWVEVFGSVATTGEPKIFDMFHAPTDGWYHCSAYRPTDSMAEVCVIFEEVTERRQAEMKLRESEARMDAVIEHLSEGLVISNLEGNLVQSNRAVMEMHGFGKRQEWLSDLGEFEEIFEISSLGGKVLPRAEWPLERVIHGESLHNLEVHLQRRGTDWKRLFSYNGRLVQQPGGNQLAFLTITDVTEQKRVEQALRISEEKFRSAFASASIGVAITTGEGVFLETNAAYHAITGYSQKELSRMTFMEIIHPEDSASNLAFIQQMLRGEIPGFVIENRYLQKGGGTVWVQKSVSVVLGPDGQPLRIIALIEDVTGRKQAERRIWQMNEELEQRVTERTAQLEEANRELEAFSYSVSHDLRAPLRAVNGFAEIVLEDYGSLLPPEGRRDLKRVCAGGQKMGQLIDDLLNFARLSRQSVNRRPLNIVQLVHNVLEEMQPLYEGRPIEFKISELPSCSADAVLLRQVWVNLLANAIKYTRGRAAAVVEVGCQRREDENVYSIRDNGAGFDMRYADKLFGVFQRLHRVDEFEGTGVGLAIAQRIIQRHNGRIWAEAEVGCGATFFFTLGSETLP